MQETKTVEEAVEHDHSTDEKANVDDRIVSAEQLLVLGWSLIQEGQNDEAINRLEEAIHIAAESNNHDIRRKASHQLGTAFALNSDYENAIGYFREARQISQDLDVEESEITAYQWLGFKHLQDGEYKESIEHYKEAVKFASQLGCKSRYVNANIGLGSAYSYNGDFASSEESFLNALGVAKELNDKVLNKIAYTNLATAYYKFFKFEAAAKSYFEAQELSREVGDKAEQGNTSLMLAHSFRHLNKYESAVECYQDALQIMKELHSKDIQINGLEKALEEANINEWCGYCCAFIDSKHEDAKSFYENAMEIAKKVGDKYQEYRANQAIESIFYNRRDYNKAKEYQQEALKIAVQLQDKYLEGLSYLHLASACSKDCNYEMAVKCYKNTVEIFSVELKNEVLKEKALTGLSNALFNLGNTKEATQSIKMAEQIFKERTHKGNIS